MSEIDKSEWGEGPWQTEPDDLRWTDEVTGMPCYITRGPMGALCGYVGVRESHPLWRRKYDHCPDGADCETYTKLRDNQIKWRAEAIRNGETDSFAMRIPVPPPDSWFGQHGHCECPYEVRPEGMLEAHGGITFSDDWEERGFDEGIWFFGFDCAHSGDATPGHDANMNQIARLHGHETWDAYMKAKYGPDFGSWRDEKVYRDIGFVKKECARLALQLHVMVETTV